MITEEELARLVERLRHAATDDRAVEVKACEHGVSASLMETVSAFANGSGGLIVLGLAEQTGFSPTPGFRPEAVVESFARQCADRLTPPVRPDIEILEYRGAPVAVAVIEEMPPFDKPCHVTDRGRYHGSYIRVGDGDRRLTTYEVDRLLEERRQPVHDRAVVDEATPADLLDDILDAIVARQRSLHPRIFGTLSRDDSLRALNIIATGADGRPHPTLSGLLVAGNYPQRWFPRLTVTVAYYPGTCKTSGNAVKYLDSRSMAGPIPEILEDALAWVSRNMRVGGVLDGQARRRDAFEYPIDAVREALCNAIMHRDYSPMGQGAQIQVNMYGNRLEIISPGGLYGPVTVDSLGEPGVSATRNRTLAALMETTPFRDGYVAENRGTGYQLITTLLRSGGNGRPEVSDTLSAFSITFRAAHTDRLAPAAAPAAGLRDGMPHPGMPHPDAPHAESRSGMPRPIASPVESRTDTPQPAAPAVGLQDGTQHPDATPTGSWAGTSYYETPQDHAADSLSELERQMLAFIAEHDATRLPQLVAETGRPRSTVTYQINKLLELGLIERTQPARSPRQSYRIRRSA